VLINDANAPRERLPQAVRVATAGAPPSPTLLGQWEAIGAELVHVYGLTETYGPHTLCDWQPQWNAEPADVRATLRARQGVANVTACELRVVDEEMRDDPSPSRTSWRTAGRGSRTSSARSRWSSDRCRRRAPGRCRSSCCGRRRGRGGRSGFSEERWKRTRYCQKVWIGTATETLPPGGS